MTKTRTKLAAINFYDWSGLINGRIVRIHGLGCASIEYRARKFVLESPFKGSEILDGDTTSTEDLHRAFVVFQSAAGERQKQRNEVSQMRRQF